MASGVGINQQCLDTFQELKLGKKHKYIIYNTNKDKTEIIVEKYSSSTDYEDFVNDLPEDECRWAIYDFEFDLPEGGKRQKIIFVSWSPDIAKIKQKMVFASSREALKQALSGVQIVVQATESSEISWESVFDKAKRLH
ncbi:hypothetical protein BDQ17DRAFT_1342940 [Cyathus striatus]|nr:hypothetical protein BDQ17DRAFT_1342940 [Cyathus striatus]